MGSHHSHDLSEDQITQEKKFAKRFALVLIPLVALMPIAVVAYFLNLKTLSEKPEVESLESAIGYVNTKLVERNDCEDGVQGYYAWETDGPITLKDEIVVCTNNFNKATDDYPALLKHEMTHIMHSCLGTTINSPDEIRELREELKESNEGSYRTIHGSYTEDNHFMEVEARWMEKQDHKYVNLQLQKHCADF